jgi:peptidoglycan/LPS O-acetylase OafA/YrhL
VLSGFVLTCALSARPTPYVTYAIRRIFRIYPAFLFVILVSYCLHFVVGDKLGVETDFLERISNPNLTLAVLLQHLLMVGTPIANRLDGVMWTLVHEMRISLIFPAILWSVTRYRWRAVVLFLVLSVVCTEFLLFWTGTGAQGYNDGTFAATVLETGYFVVFFVCGAYLAISRQSVSRKIAGLPLWAKDADHREGAGEDVQAAVAGGNMLVTI